MIPGSQALLIAIFPAHKRGTALAIWINGQRVGLWDQARGGTPTFAYDAEWLRSEYARPLSLSLPLLPEGGVHRGPRVTAYFENLLPDSQVIRRRIRERVSAKSTLAFDLLSVIGRDCVGAVQLLLVVLHQNPIYRRS